MDAELSLAITLLVFVGLPLTLSLFSSSVQLRNALLWCVIFTGGVAITGNWQQIEASFYQPQPTFTDTRIEIPKGRDNHYRLTLRINGVPVDFLVDTGATQLVLTQADAARVGLDPKTLAYVGTAFTANGQVATAPVRLDTVDLGELRDRGVRASVNSGEMEGSLLGMSYLGRFQSIEIRRNMLILTR